MSPNANVLSPPPAFSANRCRARSRSMTGSPCPTRELDPNQLLARTTSAQIERVKLRRAEKVEHSTVDKDLGVLKAFFNWCMDRGLAATNPVCRVKFFHANNERVRYLPGRGMGAAS
jgi:site-specific recombinase XerD